MVFGQYDYAAFSGFFLYASGSIALPVTLVILARELGFSLEEGGMSAGGALSLGRTMSIVAAMLLCGFLAGRWGKRRTFGAAIVLVGIGLVLCSFAGAYSVLFLSLMVVGLGDGVIEGLATPFVQDLHPQEPGRYINFAHGFWSVGIFVTVLISGALPSLGVSWRLIIAGVACCALAPATLLLGPCRKGREYPDHPEPLHWRIVHDHAAAILGVRRFWLFFAAMFAAGGGEACLTYWSASYIQLHYATGAWAGGVGLACFSAGMVLGRTGWGFFIRQHQLPRLVVFSALAGVLLTLTIPLLTDRFLFFGLLFLSGLATAPFWPSIQSIGVDSLPGKDTTMIFILLSCAGIPGNGVLVWLMGWMANRTGGLNTAFYLVPVCYLIVAVLIWADRRIYAARRKNADITTLAPQTSSVRCAQ